MNSQITIQKDHRQEVSGNLWDATINQYLRTAATALLVSAGLKIVGFRKPARILDICTSALLIFTLYKKWMGNPDRREKIVRRGQLSPQGKRIREALSTLD